MPPAKTHKVLSQAAINKAAATYKRSKKKGKYMILQGKHGKTNAKKILAASKRTAAQSKPQRKSTTSKSKTVKAQRRAPSGGIFDVLKPQQEARRDTQWNPFRDAGLMQESGLNYNRFVRPLLVNEENIVQYPNLKSLIAKYPGGARVAVSQYLRNLRTKVPALLKRLQWNTNAGQLVLENDQLVIGELQAQAIAILDVVGSVLGGTNYFGSGDVGTPTQPGYLGLSRVGEQITFTYPGGSGTSSAIAKGTYATIGKAKELLTNIQHMVHSDSAIVGSIQGGRPGQDFAVNQLLSNRQSARGRDDWQTALDPSRDFIARAQIASTLEGLWYTIERLSTDGVIDKKNRDRLTREWQSIRKEAEKLPTDDDLLKDIGRMPGTTASKEALREARYYYNIIVNRLNHLQSVVNSAQGSKVWVDKLKTQDASISWVKATLTEIVNALQPMKKLSKEQITAIESFPPTGTVAQMQAAGVLATPAQYKAAKSSLSMTENALATVKRTSSKQEAQTTLAYLFSNTEWEAGLTIAGQLAATASAVSFERVAKQQQDAWALVNDGAHRYQQVVDFGLADQSNFNHIPDSQMNDAQKLKIGQTMQLAGSFLGNRAFAKSNILMVPTEPNPATLKATLPAGIRALTSLHAEARARAAALYLVSLLDREKRFLGLVGNQQNMTYGSDAVGQLKQQAKLLKETLSGIKYDKTMANPAIHAPNGSLILSAFGVGSMNESKSALLNPADLMLYPVFRGNMLYANLPPAKRQSKRSAKYTVGGQQVGILTQQGAESWITKRPHTSQFGATEMISWTPSQAFDLRNKYFYSLYPFKLEGQFHKLYNEAIGDITQTKAPTAIAALSFNDIMAMVRGG